MSVLAIQPIVIAGAHWFKAPWFRAGENNHDLRLISFVTTGSVNSGRGKKKRQVG
jgi:hypothetical protein